MLSVHWCACFVSSVVDVLSCFVFVFDCLIGVWGLFCLCVCCVWCVCVVLCLFLYVLCVVFVCFVFVLLWMCGVLVL